MASGKSKSPEHPNGKRRKDMYGRELAPHSLRKQHRFLLECSDEELKIAKIKRIDERKSQ